MDGTLTPEDEGSPHDLDRRYGPPRRDGPQRQRPTAPRNSRTHAPRAARTKQHHARARPNFHIHTFVRAHTERGLRSTGWTQQHHANEAHTHKHMPRPSAHRWRCPALRLSHFAGHRLAHVVAHRLAHTAKASSPATPHVSRASEAPLSLPLSSTTSQYSPYHSCRSLIPAPSPHPPSQSPRQPAPYPHPHHLWLAPSPLLLTPSSVPATRASLHGGRGG